MTTVDWTTVKYFTREEMACKCGCNTADMDASFMYWLDHLRARVSVPLIISSGFRCIEHNKAVGGKDSSSHVLGLGADILIAGPMARRLVNNAIDVSFVGIGIAQEESREAKDRFVHVDMLGRNGNLVIWSY